MSYATQPSQPSQKKRKFSIAKYIRPSQSLGRKANLAAIATKLGVESKYLDTTFTSTDISNAWSTPACLNLVGIGDQPTERIGKKYHIHSIQVNARIVGNVQTDLPEVVLPSTVRIVIFQDKQTNGALPTGLEVMDTDVVESLRNAEYESRFIVHMDKVIPMTCIAGNDAAATVAQVLNPTVFRWYKKLSIDVSTIDGDADIAAIVDNSLHMICITSQVTPDPRLHMHCRIRFVG